MRASRFLTATILVSALLLQSCANDQFSHAVKSGNARMAVSTMQPNQAWLRIHERNGQVYYPIHYTICRGDAESTFALIRNGSPTKLQNRSLAYNAAKARQPALARQLAGEGYGTNADVAQAEAENRRRHVARDNSAMVAAIGIVALLALMQSGDSTQSEAEAEHQRALDTWSSMRSRGEVP